MMKVAIYGAGAVGGLIGGRLAMAGCEVGMVARGATLSAVRQNGLRVEADGRADTVTVNVTADPRSLGVQDVVIIAVKATALADVAAGIAPLVDRHTMIVSAMNGVPWWFFDMAGVPYSGTRLQSIDPDGTISRAMPVEQVLGCVVHLTTSCPQPGVVRLGFGNHLVVGEPAGGQSARTSALVDRLRAAGFDAEASAHIRTDIWYKLWGNMTVNPLSAITGATGDQILDDPLIARFCLAAMLEAADIGARIDCPITQSGEERMAVTRRLGAFKTSMLQDAEAGKPLEIDALVSAVHEIGQWCGIATPNIDCLLGIVRLFGRTHGLYKE
jgi:2-dehydropantoate 2-reductase